MQQNTSARGATSTPILAGSAGDSQTLPHRKELSYNSSISMAARSIREFPSSRSRGPQAQQSPRQAGIAESLKQAFDKARAGDRHGFYRQLNRRVDAAVTEELYRGPIPYGSMSPDYAPEAGQAAATTQPKWKTSIGPEMPGPSARPFRRG